MKNVELLFFVYANVHIYVKIFCFRESVGNAAYGYVVVLGYGAWDFWEGNFYIIIYSLAPLSYPSLPLPLPNRLIWVQNGDPKMTKNLEGT